VTTYNEHGGYPHPDHIMCHKVTMAAFDAAPDPDLYPEAGQVWQPLKLYYDVSNTREKMKVLDEAMRAEGMDSKYGEILERWDDWWKDRRVPVPTTRIYCADHFERRDAALLAHATQVDPNGWFFSVPLDVQRRVFPWEEFELARSLVDTTMPEEDLFAGIRTLVMT
jgi:mycothiol S-conjugate amidase